MTGGIICVMLLLAAPGAQRTAAAEPDGRLIVEAMEYPWSAIGRVNAGGRGHCTGFLVGPRHVLTAAHCLYNAVEGRWWGANELHFVAGYQRDQVLIHSPVSGYEASPAFDPKAGPGPENAVADWAVLRLEAPIGRQAGWLGLRVPDPALLAELDAGRARLFQAGYRSGRAHAMTANPDCHLVGVFAEGRGLAHDCPVFHGDSGSPLLAFLDGRPVALGIQVLRVESGGSVVAGAVSMAVLDADAALRS
ncbi:MAG: trypsin-like peptidase domain-containing protein, partial [Kiloniellales bacterium]